MLLFVLTRTVLVCIFLIFSLFPTLMRRSYLMEDDELEFPDEPHKMAMHSQKIAVKHKLKYSSLTRCLTRFNP
jgi:hypothetical protein